MGECFALELGSSLTFDLAHPLAAISDAIATPSRQVWNDNDRHLTRWRLDIKFASEQRRISVQFGTLGERWALHAVIEAYGMAVAGVVVDSLRLPALVARILHLSDGWQRDGRQVAYAPYPVKGTRGKNSLIGLLSREGRSCPVVVVSDLDGAPIIAGLPDLLAEEFVGCATVIHIDEEGSTAFVNDIGRWAACYQGAVRLYQPGWQRTDPSHEHPYWVSKKINGYAGDASAKAARLIGELSTWLFEHAVSTMIEPPAFAEIRQSETRRIREELRAAGDNIQVANLYALENDELKLELEEARARLTEVEDERDFWQQHFEATQRYSGNSDEPDDSEREVTSIREIPRTVTAAIARGRQLYGDELVFGDEVEFYAQRLNPRAGPPMTVLYHLKILAELSHLRRTQGGRLGDGEIPWLTKRLVDVAPEKKDAMRQAPFAAARTWKVEGEARTFSMHTRPNGHTKSDLCVRIYYAYEPARERVVVGYIGPHP